MWADSDDGLVIVVARNSPIESLSRFELKKLYLGTELVDGSGARIVPWNQIPNSPERLAFDGAVLGMAPDQVAQYWIDRKIRGQSGAPKCANAEILPAVISKQPHAIAYVRRSQVHEGLRVIAAASSSAAHSPARFAF